MNRTAQTAIAVAIAVFGLNGGNAFAGTEIWHLQNSVLKGGATVTGSFAFDTVAGTYSNIDIRSGATHFGIPDPVAPGNSDVLIAVDGVHSNYSGTPLLAMNWSSPLTATGGKVNLNTDDDSFLGTCANASCSAVGSFTKFVSGYVTTSETWYLQNAVLSNGTAVSGSFAFDPVNGSYSNINIQAGSTRFGIPNPVSPGNSVLLYAVDGVHSNYAGTPLLAMNWSSELPATGGTVNLNTAGFSFLGTCWGASCGAVGSATSFVSGYVTTTSPVPEPGSWALLLAGLFGVGRTFRTKSFRVQAGFVQA
jgi:hypothetical protein